MLPGEANPTFSGLGYTWCEQMMNLSLAILSLQSLISNKFGQKPCVQYLYNICTVSLSMV